jgi:phosphate transport system protein
MQRHFELELEDLKKELLRMGALAEEAIYEAVKALEELDGKRAQKVIDNDTVVDALENTIDEKCVDLLALQQPVAVDLRFITMVMQIATDIERIADLAVDIAQRVLELEGKPLLKPLVDIPKLSLIAQKMVKETLTAFVNKDPALAQQVIASDSQADELRNIIQKELIEDYMMKDPATSPRAVPLLLAARHLERICDHATNIAEDVIFMVLARVARHHGEKSL